MRIDKSTQITEGNRKSFHSTDCKMANRICYGYTTAADGELEKVFIRNHHEEIISTEDFEKVQRMKNERSKSQTWDFGMKMSF